MRTEKEVEERLEFLKRQLARLEIVESYNMEYKWELYDRIAELEWIMGTRDD